MKILDFFNNISPLLTALATIALVIVTIMYIRMLNEQVKIQQDPILKINPNDHFINSDIPGIFELCVYNTGVTGAVTVPSLETVAPTASPPPVIVTFSISLCGAGAVLLAKR